MKVRICKNDADVKAGVGKVFDIDVSIPDLADKYPAEQVDKWTEYGFRVWLQKDIGEQDKAKFGGRDFNKVEVELKAKAIPYTVTDWVKGETSTVSADTKAKLEVLKEYSSEEIKAAIAVYKASKVA